MPARATRSSGPVMGEHSLLLVDGPQHKRARKLLMPAFNGHALRGYESMIEGLAKTEVGSWQRGHARSGRWSG